MSFAGRRVLAKSVLSAIPLYPMQTTLISMGVCDKIESIIRKVVWGNAIRRGLVILWLGMIYCSVDVRVDSDLEIYIL